MLKEEEGAMLASSALYKRDLVLNLRKVPAAALSQLLPQDVHSDSTCLPFA